MKLSANYDAWRLQGPPEDEMEPLHPGPHEHPLLIESDDLTIDAIGVYDGDGNLTCVLIDGRSVSVADLKQALALMRLDDLTGWDRPLDSDTLEQLSADAWEYERSECP